MTSARGINVLNEKKAKKYFRELLLAIDYRKFHLLRGAFLLSITIT